MQSNKYLNAVLTVIAVLLALNLGAYWSNQDHANTIGLATPAYAGGIANAGQQRKQIAEELKRVSRQIEALKGLFTSGQARVRLESGHDQD